MSGSGQLPDRPTSPAWAAEHLPGVRMLPLLIVYPLVAHLSEVGSGCRTRVAAGSRSWQPRQFRAQPVEV